MNNLFRIVVFSISLIIFGVSFSSCQNDELDIQDEFSNNEISGIPIEFIIGIKNLDSAFTRGIDNPKSVFSQGDLIHVQADFRLSDTYNGEIISYYGILEFDGNKWSAPANSVPLQWPNAAVEGRFKAYYIPGSTGVLQQGIPLKNTLAAINPSNDPLKAETDFLQYGHAIYLDFYHVCAYLTLTEIESGIADYFWFTVTDSEDFNNAYQLVWDGEILDFKFYQEPDPDYDNLVYIAGKTYFSSIPDDSDMVSQVSFFLEPGYYDKFSLLYPRTSSTTFNYLSFNYDNVISLDSEQNIPPQFDENNTYILNVRQSEGIEIKNPGEEQGWDEEKAYDIVVKDFLEAIYNETDYFNKDEVQIIEKTSTGTRLLHNVDFKNEFYTIFPEVDNPQSPSDYFSPNIQEGRVFDGDYHYIMNLGCPLFRYNAGTIQNLGIKGVETKQDVISTQYNVYDPIGASKEMFDNSRNGLICCWNRAGKITNLMIEGPVIFNVAVKEEPKQLETHNIGGLVGSNTGELDHIEINGQIELSVKPYSSTDVNTQVAIGGLVGQNANSIFDIYGDFQLVINNSSTGNSGAFYVGGGVGTNSGYVNGIFISHLTLDCSVSVCMTSYLGGLIGRHNTDDASSGITTLLSSSNVQGRITSGNLDETQGLVAYTGSLVGGIFNGAVTDCRSTCEVWGPTGVNVNATYGTGGAFGRILSVSPSIISDLIVYGNELKGPQNYIGNFVGILPQDQSWTNYINNGLIIKAFPGFNNVGTSLQSNDF